MRCNTCGKKFKENGVDCDWRQGRCPHTPPMINLDRFKTKYYNMKQIIKGWVK